MIGLQDKMYSLYSVDVQEMFATKPDTMEWLCYDGHRLPVSWTCKEHDDWMKVQCIKDMLNEQKIAVQDLKKVLKQVEQKAVKKVQEYWIQMEHKRAKEEQARIKQRDAYHAQFEEVHEMYKKKLKMNDAESKWIVQIRAWNCDKIRRKLEKMHRKTKR